MKRQYILWYTAALVAAVIGAVALGVPLSTVLLPLVLLACPLMMMFMMGGHGHGGGGGASSGDTHEHHDSAGRS